MFEPGKVWLDTDGKPIQAHGGGVLYDKGTYYWFGENKDGETQPGYRMDVIGVSCYSSQDLLHWKNEGVVLPAVPEDPTHDLHPTQVAERPKVIYNAQTRKYMMWLHIDSPDYLYARTGCAVSDSPTGPYEYLGSISPADTDSRDMTVFQDTDGAAYVAFSSGHNSLTRIARLTADYLHTTDDVVTVFDSGGKNSGRESPALFTHNGRYFFLGSGCTGWFPNPAEYAVAPAPLGPWEVKGDPCIGPDSETTFHSQNTFVLPVVGKPGAFIFMADRWNPENLRDSRYVWLPLEIEGDTLTVRWHDRWDLSVFDR